MQKAERLLIIENLIEGENISSQEELLKKLKRKGVDITQATLSRNLRQLGAGRIADGAGGYRYVIPGRLPGQANNPVKLNIIPVITDIVDAKDLMVIKTLPGNASNTALFIDSAGRFEIAGTIAGDDTILVIPRTGINLNQVHVCLEMILPGLHEQIRKR